MNQTATRIFSGRFLVLTGIVLWNVFSCNTYAQNAVKPASKPEAPKRVVMTECEGIDNCTTWTFLTKKGYGKWRTGEEAVLEVESVKGDELTISRTDVTGSKAGLTGTYKGTLHAGRLGGEFDSHYQGHDESGNWYAILGTPAPSLPNVMHFCDVNCFTLQLQDGSYTGENGNEHWTVESFTRESAVFHRRVNNPAFEVTYKGRISEDGNSLIGVANPFCCNGGQPTNVRLSWGLALNTVPGNNAERNAIGGLRPQSGQMTVGDVLQAGSYIKDWIDVYKFFTSGGDDRQ
jgi:hypothetical protein